MLFEFVFKPYTNPALGSPSLIVSLRSNEILPASQIELQSNFTKKFFQVSLLSNLTPSVH